MTEQQYQPVDQVFIAKQSGHGSGTEWQVNTTKIRNYLETRLRGIREVEIELTLYRLYVKEQLVTEFLAVDDEQAKKYAFKYCERQKVERKNIRIEPTTETEIKTIRKRINNPLLPDEVIDNIIAPIETTFSQVGYFTKYTEEDIKDELFRNVSAIRTRLYELSYERDDMNTGNYELIINLIWNMIKQVLKASEGGFTAKGIRERTEEKMVTHTNGKKMIGVN